jgi:hypothetical protein
MCVYIYNDTEHNDNDHNDSLGSLSHHLALPKSPQKVLKLSSTGAGRVRPEPQADRRAHQVSRNDHEHHHREVSRVAPSN